MFFLELEISGVGVQRMDNRAIIEQKMMAFVRDYSVKIILRLF